MNTLIQKEFDLEYPMELVWKNLADPTEIVVCVPGAAITEKVDDRNYKGEVITKFGPIKAAYAGDIAIVELDDVNHKMVLKGRGLDSKGKGSADMIMNGDLSQVGDKVNVKFSMDITIIGKLAQFGSRLINDVSDQLLSQFVTNFKNKLAAEAATTTTETVVESVGGAASDAAGKVTEVASSAVESVSTAATTAASAVADKAADVGQNISQKAAPAVDNSLNAFSLVGTVIKSIFGGIIDFFKSLFGGK